MITNFPEFLPFHKSLTLGTPTNGQNHSWAEQPGTDEAVLGMSGGTQAVDDAASVINTEESRSGNEGDAICDTSNRDFGAETRDFTPGERNASENHNEEWVASAISSDIINLNLRSLEGNAVYDYLLYSPNLQRRNDGRLAEGTLKKYHHLDNGGWWCSGVNVLTGEDSLWGCFKPDSPRIDSEKNRSIKYEHPPKVETEIFALKVPVAIFQLVARRYDVALPENYRDVVAKPMIFWQWVLDNPQIPIILTEGAKKGACILSNGYVAIAVPGINSCYRTTKDEEGNITTRNLIPQLQVFAVPGRRVYFCFDQDSKRTTIRNVNRAISTTAKLFLNQKCEVSVITWHSLLGKGIDDVVAYGQDKFDEFYRNALDFVRWQSHQMRRLTYVPDMVINERYIGEIMPPVSAQLIAIQAPKGSGKTEWVRYLTSPSLSSGERKVLLITHRIQLSTQTAERLGIPYITRVKDTEQGKLFGYGLCIDSLHPQSQARFNPQEWKGAWVIIDEVMQVIWHLLSSSTCQSDRVKIIKTLQELLITVVRSGGKILIADADLNDVAIEFIEGLLGFSPERFLLVNEYKPTTPWEIYRFQGKDPAGMIAALEEQLESGKKALLCVSGQKFKSKWGTQVLEQYFKRKFPHLRITRIDSETAANPKHEARGCTANLNEFVVNYDLVISSPIIETGLSIDTKHFDGVWLIGQGVQTADGVRQNLSRDRNPIPRYVWIKSTGINFVGNGASSPSQLIVSQNRLDKANRSKLVEAGMQELPDGRFAPICLETWAKLGAIINLGMWDYERTILDDLVEEGHTIIDWKCKGNINPESVKDEVSSVKEEVYEKYRQDVTASEKVDEKKLEQLSRQQERTTEEILQLRKGEIEQKYGIDCTEELVKKDDERWSPKLRLHYYFDVGREFLPFKDVQYLEKAATQGQGDYFIIDSNKRLMQLKVSFLDYLGINRLYEDTGFYSGHPVVDDIFAKIKLHVNDVKLITGLNLRKQVEHPKNSIRPVQEILALFGHKMVCYSRKGKRGEEVRYYSSPAPDFQENEKTKKLILDQNGLPIPKTDGRDAVFAAWLLRDDEARRKAEEEKLAAAASIVTPQTETVATPTTAELLAEELRSVQNWADVKLSQEEINICWQALELKEQKRLSALYEQWQIEVKIETVNDEPEAVVNMELSDAIAQIDNAIKTHEPAFSPNPNTVNTWTRRLGRAAMMTKQIMQQAYEAIPSQMLNDVWSCLALGVQKSYCELYA